MAQGEETADKSLPTCTTAKCSHSVQTSCKMCAFNTIYEIAEVWAGNNLGVNKGVSKRPDVRDSGVHICGVLLY